MHVKCCATNQEFNSVLAIKTSHRIWNHLLHAMARSPLLLFFHLLIRPLVDRLQSRDQRSASLRQGILHGRRDRIVLLSCYEPVSLQLPQALGQHSRGDAHHLSLQLSPANLTYMMSGVSNREKMMIKNQVSRGDGDRVLPFPFMGWVECIANTAYDWQFSGLLNNVHTSRNGDFSQASQITHNGALLVGTYDNFTDGDPSEFLRNLNDHMPTAAENNLIFIERTGHTYQGKNQDVADDILHQLQEWR